MEVLSLHSAEISTIPLVSVDMCDIDVYRGYSEEQRCEQPHEDNEVRIHDDVAERVAGGRIPERESHVEQALLEAAVEFGGGRRLLTILQLKLFVVVAGGVVVWLDSPHPRNYSSEHDTRCRSCTAPETMAGQNTGADVSPLQSIVRPVH